MPKKKKAVKKLTVKDKRILKKNPNIADVLDSKDEKIKELSKELKNAEGNDSSEELGETKKKMKILTDGKNLFVKKFKNLKTENSNIRYILSDLLIENKALKLELEKTSEGNLLELRG